MKQLKKPGKGVMTLLDVFEIHIPAILFAAVFIMYLIMIVYRYVLNKAVFEINEMCQVLYVASALMAASYSGRTDSHVIFPLLYDRLPAGVQRVFRMISNVITTVLLVVIWYPCLKNAIWMHKKETEVLNIPFSFLYGLWLFFITMSIVYCVWFFIKECVTPPVKETVVSKALEEAENDPQ